MASVGLLYKTKSKKENISQVHVTRTTGNYGIFIDNIDNNYFSTHDSNVRDLIEAYLINKYGKTEAEKYGHSLIFYYDSFRFIEAQKRMPNNNESISAYVLYDTQTGKRVPGCAIIKDAGFYKDESILLSGSFLDSMSEIKEGICYYERGFSYFKFVDISSKVNPNETIFKDPAGQMLTASLANIDIKNRTLTVSVYNKSKKDSSGNYLFSRNISLSF